MTTFSSFHRFPLTSAAKRVDATFPQSHHCLHTTQHHFCHSCIHPWNRNMFWWPRITAFERIGWCSPTRLSHLNKIAWHPPTIRITIAQKNHGTIAFVLDKLLTMGRCICKVSQLFNTSKTRSRVLNKPLVTSLFLIAFNINSFFTAVTYNCHSNSTLVCRVTKHSKRFFASFVIRVDDVRATCGL